MLFSQGKRDYRRISNSPLFRKKDANLFMQQKRKHDEMVFLMSRNVSKHVLLAFGVNCTARESGMLWRWKSLRFWPSLHKLYPSQCHLTLVSIHVPLLHIVLVSPSLARHQSEFPTKVCFSLFDGSEVLPARLTCTKGKLSNVWHLRNLRLT